MCSSCVPLILNMVLDPLTDDREIAMYGLHCCYHGTSSVLFPSRIQALILLDVSRRS